jgi:hypothetical protein
MATVAAQLRKADPAADAFIESQVKEAGRQAAEASRVQNAKVMAGIAMEELRREFGPDNVPPSMERRLWSHFAQVPTAEEMVKADIDRRAALARIEPGLTDEEITTLYSEDAEFIKKSRTHRISQENKTAKKTDAATFMQYKNLSGIFSDQISAAEDELTTPAMVPSGFFGQEVRLTKLPREPELVALARRRAVERFRRIVAANVGKGKIARAMQILGLEEIEQDFAIQEELTPEQKRQETEDARTTVIERLRVQAEASVAP